ncbi:copper resistance protein CopB [Sphingomonas melonis TY]|jgi:copper resistance protein B|nr:MULTISPECIES: copper resistance protein B [Sphingomonas]AOW24392.1 copper resistance protein CopB [Sphingomonas melonis TY]ATI55460.1 copper resistance protein B [Sphingomonas melonis]KZB93831.1 copper resistance protein CopB [Sphingomonas melonis TY]MBI0531340.1 copper resistance protein B [Sphingomonas sp. TX0522]MBX8843925.1 copper resistance protein B [Sphingomonas melonis]
MRAALAILALLPAPAMAQMHHMDGMSMPGMTMPAAPKPAAKAKPKPKTKPKPPARSPARPQSHAHPGPDHVMAMPVTPVAADPNCPPDHAAMGHCTPAASAAPKTAMPAMPQDIPMHAMPGMHAMPAAAATKSGTDLPAGNAPPPPPPTTRAADRFYDPAAMAAADRTMRAEHGGMRFSQILFNLAEVQVRHGGDGYRWDGEGWFGGDIDRVVLKSEGEGTFGRSIDQAEVQALYAHAIGPYFNLLAGARQDLGPNGGRTHAAIGVEGLAPYWFDVEATLFASDKGVRARGSAWYDQRLTQRAILQPRVEVNLAAQDEPDARIGAGLSSVEAGLRLRYEIAREFAPYVGVNWERRYGATARYARADGEGSGGVSLALGIRGWF